GALDFLFSELVLTSFAEIRDRTILQSNYANMVHAFQQLKLRCHTNGLFPSIGMYPDLPANMGRSEAFYVAIDQGCWYGFCRNMEKIALIIGDLPTARESDQAAQKIAALFLSCFWNDEKEFICDSFDPHQHKQLDSFPIFSLLFLESAFGIELLSDKIIQLADFIEYHLLADNGLRMTPVWDRNHRTEPAMSAWYPHWDFVALRLLARASRWQAVCKWLGLVEVYFSRLGYCPEFISTNYFPPQQWQHHGAAWNLNCAAGWYNALIDAVVGLSFDIGGITCLPTAAVAGYKLNNLAYRGGSWSVTKVGKGNHIKQLEIDAEIIRGSTKIPARFYTSDYHTLKIVYHSKQAAYPVLTEAPGVELSAVKVKTTETFFEIKGSGWSRIYFTALDEVEALFDGRAVAMEWSAENGSGSVNLLLNGEHHLIVRRKN
ncbi:MAG: hypothetical protein SCK70_07220, partial [bacterium]|nr:hypothetical protein [bacterium]